MVLIDSDIFVIDRRYPRGVLYPITRAFLNHVATSSTNFGTTLFNVLEVCGILSFGYNTQQFLTFYAGFAQHYRVQILRPPFKGPLPDEALDELVSTVVAVMLRKMSFGDALMLTVAEADSLVNRLITWNARHFQGKTRLLVETPEEYLLKIGTSVQPPKQETPKQNDEMRP
jgi:hypothetical protein